MNRSLWLLFTSEKAKGNAKILQECCNEECCQERHTKHKTVYKKDVQQKKGRTVKNCNNNNKSGQYA